MNKKAKIAIIGVGGIAQIAHIPIWKKLENAELVAVFDRNLSRAKWVAERFEIPCVCQSYGELLGMEEIDAVDICTPTASHAELATLALKAGKHALVEKPMAINHQEASNMTSAAIEHDRRLMVAMNVRYRPDSMILHKFTQKGELGNIFYAKAGWLRPRDSMFSQEWFADRETAGGGVFMDLGIQMLDVSLWLMGEPKAKSVNATTYNNSGLSVEDSAAVFIRLDNDATLTIEVSWSLLSENDIFYTNLFGTQGGGLLFPLRIHKELHGSLVNLTPSSEHTEANLYKWSYENEIRHFNNCIVNDSIEVPSPEHNLERMRIVDAIYESARIGREVRLN